MQGITAGMPIARITAITAIVVITFTVIISLMPVVIIGRMLVRIMGRIIIMATPSRIVTGHITTISGDTSLATTTIITIESGVSAAAPLRFFEPLR